MTRRSVFGAADHCARRLVPQDQGRRAARIMAQVGMHVGPADPSGLDPDQVLARLRRGVRYVAVDQVFDAFINQSFHFAVNPPSTIRICPVT